RMQRPASAIAPVATIAASSASYDLAWIEQDAVTLSTQRAPIAWLVLAGEDGSSNALAARLTARGDRCLVVDAADGASSKPVRKALELARELTAMTDAPRLWIVTRGAQALGDDAGEIAV